MKKRVLLLLMIIVGALVNVVLVDSAEAITKNEAESLCRDWGGSTFDVANGLDVCDGLSNKKSVCESNGGTWYDAGGGKGACMWNPTSYGSGGTTGGGTSGGGTSGGGSTSSGSSAGCDLGSGPNKTETNIFGTVCDDGNGSAMKAILNLILQILTYGVGVGGVLGIVISGVQYLTARDNEAQAAKARRRILEVVIGLIVYAVMYVVLQFLLIPGGVN